MFFLLTGSIQTIKDISPTSQFGTLLPLAVVLLLTAIKEIFEDSKRYAVDRAVNSSDTHVLVPEKSANKPVLFKFQNAAWRDVHVGDIVRVNSEQFFPADIVFISSSEKNGTCYVETSQLDGETNLKFKQALIESSSITNAVSLANMKGSVESEGPNSNLYTYAAKLILGSAQYSLGTDQLLLRV